jgi:HEPN domain-containing protein
VNRYDLQRLAAVRLGDARVLLEHGRFEGCYYLAGYAVECGLKACIAKMTNRYDFPDKKRTLDAYTHDLPQLVIAARLKGDLDAELQLDPQFKVHWYAAAKWSEQSRYQTPDRKRAESMLKAVADRRHGVLRWIRRHW